MRFADIPGQGAVKKRLAKSVKENRVSHAQLFLGPEGSGKLALAIAYAQYVNCRNRSETDSCGECPSCIKYAKLVHPDLHFVYPVARIGKIEKPVSTDFVAQWRDLVLSESAFINLPQWYAKIGIEKKQAIINARDCNQIIKTLSYKSYESEYKVMVIWMVEKLFHSAAPKILKILEEPPDKTLFILVSEDTDQMLATVLSRTQLIKIPRLDDKSLADALYNEFDDPVQVNDAVRVVAGNYLLAKKILKNPDADDFNFLKFREWMRLCFGYKMKESLKFVGELSKFTREKQKAFLNYSLRMIRESMFLSYKTDDLVRLNSKEMEFINKFYPFITSKNLVQISTELNDAVYHVERNANSSVLFLDLTLKIGKLLKS
ncbi:MAG: DNA polymerase III subunit delta [Chlorobi bacterium]|nr:DNA polymerase III subunit delta [Chlorobiota bacterium]